MANTFSFNRRFLVTATMPSGNITTSGVRNATGVDVLVRALIEKGASGLLVVEGGGAPEDYQAWRARLAVKPTA